MNASSAGRLGKYTSVDAEMSSHEDSSIGSDSEDDSIERNMHAALCSRDEGKMERRRSKSDSPLSQPLSLFCSITEPSRKLSREIDEHEEAEDPGEFRSKREDRQVGNHFNMSFVTCNMFSFFLNFSFLVKTYYFCER